MFGHLKAEDFTNLIEGGELASRRRTHLKSCARCTDAFESAQSLHTELTKSVIDEQDIPEPDWFQFRADVRTTMLSRAAQRQTSASNWTGWILRPAVTWSLAVAFTAGLSAGLLIWNHQGTNIQSASSSVQEKLVSLDINDPDPTDVGSTDPAPVDLGMTSWSPTSVFDELSQLTDMQADKLQLLLESDIRKDPAKR
jgi:predicted anti-sigma-YlaC factor YlaD